jgi:SAM-dependent methyltransferase
VEQFFTGVANVYEQSSYTPTSGSMKDERFFDADGFYQFLVEKNVLLHKEAVKFGIDAVTAMLAKQEAKPQITVLDLACGGAPLSICKILEKFPDVCVSYRGLDINSGQVRLAQSFSYPANFCGVNVVEGDAWDLSNIESGSIDIIFTGLNLHHGSPGELYVLAREIRRTLQNDGVFINHDMYRPKNETYLRRPDYNLQDAAESYLMMPTDRVANSSSPDFNFPGNDYSLDYRDDWRLTFLAAFRRVLLERGGDEIGIDSACNHVFARDFCLSTDEMTHIFETAGFVVSVHDYSESSEPLKSYYASLICKKRLEKSKCGDIANR